MTIRIKSISLGGIGVLASALLLTATPASAGNVGYYDLVAGEGQAYQVPPITAAGETAIKLTELSPATLASIDVLFALNPSNNIGYGAEYVTALPDITAAVNSGLVLCFAGDRRVAEAASNIPGGSAIMFTRAPATNIDILDNTTLVTIGSNGTITDTNLDGGNFSHHGFATTVSLPAGNTAILSNGVATRAVTFSYPQGAGAVVYSTVPTDFYLKGFGVPPPTGPGDNFQFIYAPNMVEYCASLVVIEVPAKDCAEPGGCDLVGITVELGPGAVFDPDVATVSARTVLVDDDESLCGVKDRFFDVMDTEDDDTDDFVLRKEICGAPRFAIKIIETTGIDFPTGVVEITNDPSVFFENARLCQAPIPDGVDPREQDIVYWQTTDRLLMLNGTGEETTKDCDGSSRGFVRFLSYFGIGTYYFFREDNGRSPPPELNLDGGNPESVEQAFIAITRVKLGDLKTATDNATVALTKKGDQEKLQQMIKNAIKLFDRGNFNGSLNKLKNYRKFVERATFETSPTTFNHNGELRWRVDNAIFMHEVKVIPFAP